MGFEIERKYLVTNAGWRPAAQTCFKIRQAYLTHSEKASIRVRIRDEVSATLTVKSRGSGPRRLEIEYPIDVGDAEAMLALRQGAVIEKERWLVPHGDHVWEVDMFLGENAGLQIAEIELRDINDAFIEPTWIGQEVTGQPSYYNSALAHQPFSQWAGNWPDVSCSEPD